MLELRSVSKAYREGERERVVLERASAAIAAGEVVAVVGPSGAGKSTVLNLAGGLDLPDAGEVLLAGERLSGLDDRARTLARRRLVGFVFQSFNLIPTLTVAENVRLPLELNGAPPARAARRAADLLDSLGLGDRAASFPDRLSGGEQQRVAIARAVAHDPPLVLADEPTGNLDPEAADRVVDRLRELVAGGARAVVLATHSRRAAGRAHRVLAVSGHRLVATDPADPA